MRFFSKESTKQSVLLYSKNKIFEGKRKKRMLDQKPNRNWFLLLLQRKSINQSNPSTKGPKMPAIYPLDLKLKKNEK